MPASSISKQELTMNKFGVYSEVGRLRKVIVHRPELSLQRCGWNAPSWSTTSSRR
jgi:hypothetical protein